MPKVDVVPKADVRESKPKEDEKLDALLKDLNADT